MIPFQILKKGELQVGEKERQHNQQNLHRDIATQIAEKCVDPATQRPYSVSMIEKAMAEVGFSIKADKSAKSQALECIKILQEKSTLPIQRARMRVRITMPTKDGKRLKEKVVAAADQVEEDDFGTDEWEVVGAECCSFVSWGEPLLIVPDPLVVAAQILLIDPGQFRVLTDLLAKETKGKGRMETLSFANMQSEGNLE